MEDERTLSGTTGRLIDGRRHGDPHPSASICLSLGGGSSTVNTVCPLILLNDNDNDGERAAGSLAARGRGFTLSTPSLHGAPQEK